MHLLSPPEYRIVTPLLRKLPINTLFARLVSEGHAEGEIAVDDPLRPSAGYVWHSYGMSLFFGDTTVPSIREGLASHLAGEARIRPNVEWLQVHPDGWSHVVDEIFGGRIVRSEIDPSLVTIPPDPGGAAVRDTRVNFVFNPERHSQFAAALDLPHGCEIIDDVGRIYAEMHGSVTPSIFWRDPDELAARGAAFALLCDGSIASVAFSAFTLGDELELGVETSEQFRGRGFAVHACNALLRYCLERDLEPIWACRLGNLASYRLALRLGFEHTRSIPYYRLAPTVALARSTT